MVLDTKTVQMQIQIGLGIAQLVALIIAPVAFYFKMRSHLDLLTWRIEQMEKRIERKLDGQ